LDSLWAIHRGYWNRWEMLNFRRQPIGDKTDFPSGYWLKVAISIPFLEVACFCFYLLKVEENSGKF
jgi:hypothetical protein